MKCAQRSYFRLCLKICFLDFSDFLHEFRGPWVLMVLHIGFSQQFVFSKHGRKLVEIVAKIPQSCFFVRVV